MESQIHTNSIDIKQNMPLAPYTTFKIGGPAKFFAEAEDEKGLFEALDYAKKNNMKIFILGGGSNILVSDDGFDGLVIRLNIKSEKFDFLPQDQGGYLLECQAGDNLASVVRSALEKGFSGLEWAIGIPGTIGGAVAGNAAAYGSDMAGTIESVSILDTAEDSSSDASMKTKDYKSKIKTYLADDCRFGYRDSVFKSSRNLIILSCVLKLRKGDKETIRKSMDEIREKRSGKIPRGFSAGSFFQNPTVEKRWIIERFEKDKGVVCRNNKVPAGWIIEEIGFRGKKIGGVQVSEDHGNFILNLGNGTAHDVIMLSSLIKQKARVELGIQLREEVLYIGF